MQTAPKVVEITFGEPPDPRLSSITVVNSSGTQRGLPDPTTASPAIRSSWRCRCKPIGNGVYTVTWKTVSEIDGHLATGAYAFGVGESAASANAHATKSVVSPPPSILAVVARWLFFIGVMGIAGIASTCLIALRDVPTFARRMLAGAWLASAAGVAGIVEAQREAAGVSLSALFSTSLGTAVVERIVADRRDRTRGRLSPGCCPLARRRIGVAVAGVGAAASMWVDVASSHAGRRGARRGQPADPVGAHRRGGVWIGGLLVLLLARARATVGRQRERQCAGSRRLQESRSWWLR